MIALNVMVGNDIVHAKMSSSMAAAAAHAEQLRQAILRQGFTEESVDTPQD